MSRHQAATDGTGQGLGALVEPGRWPQLAGALGDWVPSQRWFQGKARVVTGLRVVEAVLLDGASGATSGPGVLVVVVEVAYAGGAPERYQVPLVAGETDDDGLAASPGGLAASACGTVLRDALGDAAACRTLAALALSGEARAGGRLRGQPVAPARGQPVAPARGQPAGGQPVAPASALAEGPVRPLGVEQSNSSVVIGEAILKLFRKLEPGPNPEVELTRALTAAGFEHVPAQHGAVVLDGGGTETALAVLSAYVPDARDGWALACEQADAVAAGAAAGPFERSVGDLGAVVGRMHAVLAGTLGALPGQPGTSVAWAAHMRAHLRDVLALARARAPRSSAPVLAAAGEIDQRLAQVAELAVTGPLVRVHGDLHLGQVLLDGRGHRLDSGGHWLVLDFEGEPARPLAERGRPQSPLRDAAGMLRSFDYAAAHADPEVPPRLAAWREDLRAAFTTAYVGSARAAGLLPGEHAAAALLDAFELDKAVYELAYELSYRPDWIAIPVGGILRVLERRGSP